MFSNAALSAPKAQKSAPELGVGSNDEDLEIEQGGLGHEEALGGNQGDQHVIYTPEEYQAEQDWRVQEDVGFIEEYYPVP